MAEELNSAIDKIRSEINSFMRRYRTPMAEGFAREARNSKSSVIINKINQTLFCTGEVYGRGPELLEEKKVEASTVQIIRRN